MIPSFYAVKSFVSAFGTLSLSNDNSQSEFPNLACFAQDMQRDIILEKSRHVT
jgi:hypothetical protein